MEFVEHLLGVILEGRCEQVVEVDLVFLVNARYSHCAAITTVARAGDGAGLLVRALFSNDFCDSGRHFALHRGIPVLETSMSHDEVGEPRVGLGHDILVHTVFEVLLLMSVEEEIETGEVTERDILAQTGTLLEAE